MPARVENHRSEQADQHDACALVLGKRKGMLPSNPTFRIFQLLLFLIIFYSDDEEFQFFKLLHRDHLVGGMIRPVSWKNVALIHHKFEKRKKCYTPLPEYFTSGN